MAKNNISGILAKARAKKYEEVVNDYLKLSDSEQLNEVVLIAYGDSLYELKNDLGALEIYLKFVLHYPNGRAADFSLFGAALTLKNLDLQEQANFLLQLINKGHPGLEEELADSKEKLEQQCSAKEILKKFQRNKVR